MKFPRLALGQIVMANRNSIAAAQNEFILNTVYAKVSHRAGSPTIPRVRKSLTQVFRELGPTYFRRSFRMSWLNYRKLFNTIKNDLYTELNSPKEDRNYAPNGPISLTVRLAAAIRFWAGGDPYDISVMFGISHTDVFKSVNTACEAINKCDELKIVFPSSHNEQRKIVEGFKAKSEVDFDCCVGCIDGLLIWMHKPSKEECKEIGVDETKFFCGRKHKYGLNLQAICDHKK